MQADIFEKEVIVCKVKGAGLSRRVYYGGHRRRSFADAEEAADKLVEFDDRSILQVRRQRGNTEPHTVCSKKIYAANKELFEIEY